jgi:YD repeat-containing protein
VVPLAPGGDHHFTLNSRDLVQQSTPADVGPLDESTWVSYSLDNEPTTVTLPDGSVVELYFDEVGRLAAVSSPSGAATFDYFPKGSPSAGKLAVATSADGVEQTFAYAGALVTDASWAGAVTGTLHYTYDNQFRAVSETVSNTPAVVRTWNADGQPMAVGDLQMAYDAATGIFQGTTLGSIHDAVGFNAFGEPASYSATAGAPGTPLFSRTYARDGDGRITQATNSDGRTFAFEHDANGNVTAVGPPAPGGDGYKGSAGPLGSCIGRQAGHRPRRERLSFATARCAARDPWRRTSHSHLTKTTAGRYDTRTTCALSLFP